MTSDLPPNHTPRDHLQCQKGVLAHPQKQPAELEVVLAVRFLLFQIAMVDLYFAFDLGIIFGALSPAEIILLSIDSFNLLLPTFLCMLNRVFCLLLLLHEFVH